MRVLYRVATLIGLRRVAAMRTIVRQRFTSWVSAPGLSTACTCTRPTQITSGMSIRNARETGCRSTDASIASAIPRAKARKHGSLPRRRCARTYSLDMRNTKWTFAGVRRVLCDALLGALQQPATEGVAFVGANVRVRTTDVPEPQFCAPRDEVGG